MSLILHKIHQPSNSQDALNKTLTLLVEQNMLDIDNVDKFSGWWDVDQEIKSGVLLYFHVPCSTWPSLPHILAEPVRLLIQSALEVLGFMSRAEAIKFEKLETLLNRNDPFRKRTIRFYVRQNIFKIDNNILTVIDPSLLLDTIEKLIAFDM